jgi:hypothetical protein
MDYLKKIKELNELRKKGALSDFDFNEKKRVILKENAQDSEIFLDSDLKSKNFVYSKENEILSRSRKIKFWIGGSGIICLVLISLIYSSISQSKKMKDVITKMCKAELVSSDNSKFKENCENNRKDSPIYSCICNSTLKSEEAFCAYVSDEIYKECKGENSVDLLERCASGKISTSMSDHFKNVKVGCFENKFEENQAYISKLLSDYTLEAGKTYCLDSFGGNGVDERISKLESAIANLDTQLEIDIGPRPFKVLEVSLPTKSTFGSGNSQVWSDDQAFGKLTILIGAYASNDESLEIVASEKDQEPVVENLFDFFNNAKISSKTLRPKESCLQIVKATTQKYLAYVATLESKAPFLVQCKKEKKGHNPRYEAYIFNGFTRFEYHGLKQYLRFPNFPFKLDLENHHIKQGEIDYTDREDSVDNLSYLEQVVNVTTLDECIKHSKDSVESF